MTASSFAEEGHVQKSREFDKENKSDIYFWEK